MLPRLSRTLPFFKRSSRAFSSNEAKELKVISLGDQAAFLGITQAKFYSLKDAAHKKGISVTRKKIGDLLDLPGPMLCREIFKLPDIAEQFEVQNKRPSDEQDRQDIYQDYLDYQGVNISRYFKLTPGLIEFLLELVKRDIIITLHTECSRDEAEILKKLLLNIDHNLLFNFMATLSDMNDLSSNKNFFTKCLEKTRKEFDCVTGEMLIIGGPKSINAARLTGDPSIGVVGLNEMTTSQEIYTASEKELINGGASKVISLLTEGIKAVEEYEKHLAQLATNKEEYTSPSP